MKFYILSLFPERIEQCCSYGVVGQALSKGLFQLEGVQIREFAQGIHRSVDDRPFGGGDGMVMLYEPLKKAMESIPDWKSKRRLFLSPQGQLWTDDKVRYYFEHFKEIIVVSGRYGGVDQRFLNDYVEEEISIGDYVLSGGELAAAVMIDSLVRYLPGALGHQDSSVQDSWSVGLGGLFETPQFTRPQSLPSQTNEFPSEVPSVLLSGNHAEIQKWKKMVSYAITLYKRPEVFFRSNVTSQQKRELMEFWNAMSLSERKALGFQNWEMDHKVLFP